jgi:hypothetical protein
MSASKLLVAVSVLALAGFVGCSDDDGGATASAGGEAGTAESNASSGGEGGAADTAGAAGDLARAGAQSEAGAVATAGAAGSAGHAGTVTTAGQTGTAGAAGNLAIAGTAGAAGTVATAGQAGMAGAAGDLAVAGAAGAAGDECAGVIYDEAGSGTRIESLESFCADRDCPATRDEAIADLMGLCDVPGASPGSLINTCGVDVVGRGADTFADGYLFDETSGELVGAFTSTDAATPPCDVLHEYGGVRLEGACALQEYGGAGTSLCPGAGGTDGGSGGAAGAGMGS